MPEHEKFRKDLSPQMLKQMATHLNKVDKPFYLACLMQYYTLIRPGEMSNLKIGDISIKRQSVFVSKEFSKNHKDAEVGLNKIVIKLMLDLGVFNYPNDFYLFGSKFKPSKEKYGGCKRRTINEMSHNRFEFFLRFPHSAQRAVPQRLGRF